MHALRELARLDSRSGALRGLLAALRVVFGEEVRRQQGLRGGLADKNALTHACAPA